MNQCNDPDHGAINAERAESRGLRKAWVELDDKRQILEKQLAAVTEQRDQYKAALQSADNHNHEIGTKLEIVTEQRDEARRLAEKYRNLSCDSQEEADETLLPWENNQPKPESKDPHRFCRGGGGNNFHCGCKYDG